MPRFSPAKRSWLDPGGLSKYTFSTMLRAWVVALVILAAPLLYFVKARIPLPLTSGPRRFDFAFVGTSTFWILQAGNIAESLGFFMPNIYLPSYARTLGLSSLAGTVTVALFNTSSVFRAILLGALVDRFHVTSVIKNWSCSFSLPSMGSRSFPPSPLHIQPYLRSIRRRFLVNLAGYHSRIQGDRSGCGDRFGIWNARCGKRRWQYFFWTAQRGTVD